MRKTGEAHHRAKLSDNEVWEIRQLRAQGLRYREIAARTGRNLWTVRDVAVGRTRPVLGCALAEAWA